MSNKNRNKHDAERNTMAPQAEQPKEGDLLSGAESSGSPEAEAPPEQTPPAEPSPEPANDEPRSETPPESHEGAGPEPSPPQPYKHRVTDAGLIPNSLRNNDNEPCDGKIAQYLSDCWTKEEIPNIPGLLVWTE